MTDSEEGRPVPRRKGSTEDGGTADQSTFTGDEPQSSIRRMAMTDDNTQKENQSLYNRKNDDFYEFSITL